MGEESEAFLEEKTALGLHEELFDFFKKTVPLDTSILDCGAGSGAWVTRLIDAGYQNVKALDIRASKYQGASTFYEADLNSDFSSILNEEFDYIIAIEVIEHLENPAHFLRQCSQMLKSNGQIIVTTPNIESAPGRLKFLIQGRLRHFDSQGDRTHITPISMELLPKLAAKSGLRIVQVRPLLRLWEERRFFLRAISRLISLACSGHVYGECHLIVLRKS